MEETVSKFDGKLFTLNSSPGWKLARQQLITSNGREYREWDPYRSKLAAAIINKLKTLEIKQGSSVLYIGSATGTTSSHVSDIVGNDGVVYCIEISERNMRQFLNSCENRENMIPILADASKPEQYSDIVSECDVLYQDISTRNQAEILLRNAKFLKRGGIAYFAIKSQSIDISKSPNEIYNNELKVLEKDFNVLEKIDIEPYEKKHMFAVLRKK